MQVPFSSCTIYVATNVSVSIEANYHSPLPRMRPRGSLCVTAKCGFRSPPYLGCSAAQCPSASRPRSCARWPRWPSPPRSPPACGTLWSTHRYKVALYMKSYLPPSHTHTDTNPVSSHPSRATHVLFVPSSGSADQYPRGPRSARGRNSGRYEKRTDTSHSVPVVFHNGFFFVVLLLFCSVSSRFDCYRFLFRFVL